MIEISIFLDVCPYCGNVWTWEDEWKCPRCGHLSLGGYELSWYVGEDQGILLVGEGL